MKQILLSLCLLITFNISSQEKEKGKFFKSIYEDLFKYSTLYIAGDIKKCKRKCTSVFCKNKS